VADGSLPYLEIVDRLARCGDHYHSLLSHPHRELINDSLKRNILQHCFGSGSKIQSGQWIRIQEGKNDPQKQKTVKKFHVLECWMFSFEAEGFSCS
jgi:hypothetical protein